MTLYEVRALVNDAKKRDPSARTQMEQALVQLAQMADSQLEALDSKRRIGRTGKEALKPTAAELILREVLR